MTRTLLPQWPLQAIPAYRRNATRRLLARALQAASAALSDMALRVAKDEAPAISPTLEFHTGSGAEGGTLYADGVLVGRLPGVNRL